MIVLVNFLLKLLNRFMIKRERHVSKEDEQIAMFNRLALLYLVNSVLSPIIIYSFPFGATQAWYEEGGTVTQGVIFILAAGLMPAANQLVQPVPVAQARVIVFQKIVSVQIHRMNVFMMSNKGA